MKAIRVPIASCSFCWSAGVPNTFNMGEWLKLKLVDEHDGVEVRTCNRCEHRVSTDIEAAKEWDVWMPAEEYYQIFPESPRVPQEVPRVLVAGSALKFGTRVVPRLAKAALELWARLRGKKTAKNEDSPT